VSALQPVEHSGDLAEARRILPTEAREPIERLEARPRLERLARSDDGLPTAVAAGG